MSTQVSVWVLLEDDDDWGPNWRVCGVCSTEEIAARFCAANPGLDLKYEKWSLDEVSLGSRLVIQ